MTLPMLEHTPPRREPRVLLVRRSHGSHVWAAVDPFEVRGLGRIRSTNPVAVRLSLARIVLRTHPSAIVVFASRTRASELDLALRGIADRAGLPLVLPTATERRAMRACSPGAVDLAGEFPELVTVRSTALCRSVALAAAALSTLTLPPRRYVPGLPSVSAPRVGHTRPRVPRTP